ncbi:uncharacterized protein C8orf88 homolog isoform 1-T1 [Polymixia lowei]
MEVSKRRVLQKHLEPARPLRRSSNIEQGNADTCAQALIQVEDQEINIGVEQFYKIVHLHKEKQGRICYTRDFLIGLACCPVAKRKPEFLPEHPIVLPKARDPGLLSLPEITWKESKEEMVV